MGVLGKACSYSVPSIIEARVWCALNRTGSCPVEDLDNERFTVSALYVVLFLYSQ